MNIAIIGSGISGLTCAWKLAPTHQVTLFEANDYPGGHTATVDVTLEGQHYAIDTGFIVYNERTYPNFIALLDELGISGQPTEMSFSVTHPSSGLEYNGHTLNTLFAQRRNLLNPRFYRFLLEILRFNRQCKKRLSEGSIGTETLNDFLHQNAFSNYFAQHYLLPMGAAIWSSSMADMRQFPLVLFLRFFDHHGLLDITNRPQWFVVPGGSREYIRRMLAVLAGKFTLHLNTPVLRVERHTDHSVVHSSLGEQRFDQIIFACHADQALHLLSDASPLEQQILSQLPYQANEVVLHTDTQLLPRQRRAWASWNYLLPTNDGLAETLRASVTYNMNILQGLQAPHTFCVTLNPQQPVNPTQILRQFTYHHPVFNQASAQAQQQRSLINGQQNTWFCGAYWYHGFHEDGVRSALDVTQALLQAQPV
ncbi:NAD(P)/FAD-dependent oxidoreductase [Serratia sp. UGAL515B_01]|uniref:NAD(P)/FAD-dependent oxidoreductase n=1 Tax=Serratia sp. UGAL515B_01 TaxID=2986763 RepID=UPI002952A81F|nr:FAD-dependent oxidoreductase [Serratia sp. UGAL515B_01]WON78065.1 FAD-dependent oxidoreductase [Serratia sp. UGAL515B_01]